MTRLINHAILAALASTALSASMATAALAQAGSNAPAATASTPPSPPAALTPPPSETVPAAALPPVNRPPVAEPAPVSTAPETPPINKPPAPEPVAAEPPARPKTEIRYTINGEVEASAEKTRALRVEKGDTVKSLAEHFRATKTAIIEANKLKKPYELEVGQALKIPTPKVYVVRAGDTLYGIGRRFGVPADLLAELNDLEVGARLRPGAKIILPQDIKDKGPIAERVVEGARATPPERSEHAYQRIEAPESGETRYQPPVRGATPAPVEPQLPPLSDAQISAAGQGRFTWPLRGDTLTPFGPMADGQFNNGLDIAAPLGTPIQAAAAGDVVYAGAQLPGLGTLVLIRHEDGWVTVYTHLSKTLVKIKDHVSQGDTLGEVGQTGGAAQPMLHFEIRMARAPKQKALPINPLLVLPK